jgi:hypothetical protein
VLLILLTDAYTSIRHVSCGNAILTNTRNLEDQRAYYIAFVCDSQETIGAVLVEVEFDRPLKEKERLNVVMAYKFEGNKVKWYVDAIFKGTIPSPEAAAVMISAKFQVSEDPVKSPWISDSAPSSIMHPLGNGRSAIAFISSNLLYQRGNFSGDVKWYEEKGLIGGQPTQIPRTGLLETFWSLFGIKRGSS